MPIFLFIGSLLFLFQIHYIDVVYILICIDDLFYFSIKTFPSEKLCKVTLQTFKRVHSLSVVKDFLWGFSLVE